MDKLCNGDALSKTTLNLVWHFGPAVSCYLSADVYSNRDIYLQSANNRPVRFISQGLVIAYFPGNSIEHKVLKDTSLYWRKNPCSLFCNTGHGLIRPEIINGKLPWWTEKSLSIGCQMSIISQYMVIFRANQCLVVCLGMKTCILKSPTSVFLSKNMITSLKHLKFLHERSWRCGGLQETRLP